MASSWHAGYAASVHQHVRFAPGRFGYSGFATAPIPPGTEVLALPYASALSEPYALATAHGKAAVDLLGAAHPKEVTGRMVLYLVMVAERGGAPAPSPSPAAASSFFGPYLRSLPRTYDDPLWWSADERSALLAGTNLAHGAEHRLSWLRRVFSVFFPALSAAHPALFPPAVFTWEAFLWAHSAFSSRGFPHVLSVPPQQGQEAGAEAGLGAASSSSAAATSSAAPASAASASSPVDPLTDPHVNPFQADPREPVGCMLPVLDILNHQTRTPVSWIRHKDRVAFVTGVGEGGEGSSSAAPSAAPTIPAGAEITNNYGAKSNEELLLAFGFVLEPNPYDTFSLAVHGLHGGGAQPQGEEAQASSAASAAASSSKFSEEVREAKVAAARANIASIVTATGIPRRFVCRRRAPAPPAPDEDDPSLPADLLRLVRVLALTGKQLELLSGEVSSSDPARIAAVRDVLSRPLHRVTEERALHRLADLLDGKLRALLGAQPWAAAAAEKAGGAGVAAAAAGPAVTCPGDVPGAGSSAEPGTEAAAAAAAPATAASLAYRQHMARVYVRGQVEILRDALGRCSELLAAATRAPGACAHVSSAGGGERLEEGIASEEVVAAAVAPFAPSTGAVCSMGLVKADGSVQGLCCGRYVTTGGGGQSTPSSSDDNRVLLSLPLEYVLTPDRLPDVLPALAAMLDKVGGLEVSRSDDEDEEGEEEEEEEEDGPSLHTSFLQLAFTLIALRHMLAPETKPQPPQGKKGAGKKRKADEAGMEDGPGTASAALAAAKSAANLSGLGGGTAAARERFFSVWYPFIQSVSRDYSADRVYGHRAACGFANSPASVFSSLLHFEVVEAVVEALPKDFKPAVFTQEAWTWACDVVSAFAIPLLLPPAGGEGAAAARLALVPLFPRLPCTAAAAAAAAGGGGGVPPAPAQQLADRVRALDSSPMGARWEVAGGSLVLRAPCTAACPPRGSGVALHPSFVCGAGEPEEGREWLSAGSLACSEAPTPDGCGLGASRLDAAAWSLQVVDRMAWTGGGEAGGS
jgi:hypothetical protein